jgi:hypothetical protein
MALSSSHPESTCGGMGVLGLQERLCGRDYPLGAIYSRVITRLRAGLELARAETVLLPNALFS